MNSSIQPGVSCLAPPENHGSIICAEPPTHWTVGGSLCSALAGVARGAEIVRVHDVGETVQALEVAKGLALIDRID